MKMKHSRPDEEITPSARLICHHCISNPYLKDLVRRTGKVGNCFYCGNRAKSYTILQISELILRAFDSHYAQVFDEETDYDDIPEGEPVNEAISEAAGIPETAAEDIRDLLAYESYDHELAQMGFSSPFDDDSWYIKKDIHDHHWQRQWEEFERILKFESRFFNQEGMDLLQSIFKDIGDMETHDGRSLIKLIVPGSELSGLHRARVFHQDEKLREALARPETGLGPPPAPVAYAGRMNARGIAVFYGSSDPGVSIAEVRPPVGSKVAVARFDVIRPLQLLDLTALAEIKINGSIFDESYARRLSRSIFLARLSTMMTRPVMPDDEAAEYLVTQAVADYLATRLKGTFDGIIYPSVQAKGLAVNVVLFHKASKVQPLGWPKGTRSDLSTAEYYDGEPEPEYRLNITFPAEPEPDPNYSDFLGMRDWDTNFGTNKRNPALAISLDSIRVHHVEAVSFHTLAYAVATSTATEQIPPPLTDD